MENDRPSLHLILQVLEKVKHENIVKLLAIEEEQEGRGKVEPVLTYVVLCSPWDARLAA